MKHSEEDIKKTINYIKSTYPDRANRKNAIKLLDSMQSFAKSFVNKLSKGKSNKILGN